jgi:hypothetical protein
MNEQPNFDGLRSPQVEEVEWAEHEALATAATGLDKMEFDSSSVKAEAATDGSARTALDLFAEAIASDTVDGDTLLPLALALYDITFDSLTEPTLRSLLETMRDVGNMTQEHVDGCLKAYWKRKASSLSSNARKLVHQ